MFLLIVGVASVPVTSPGGPRLGIGRLSRRNACSGFGTALAALASPTSAAQPTSVTDPVSIYFGAGCFWHVQHEFTLHEAADLERRGVDITAVSGYAGGTKLGEKNRVCYHNMQQFADYGRLGHAEAVQVTIPADRVESFARKYFSLFGTRGYRHDPQDRGGEYRSVIGLPGGTKSALYQTVAAAAKDSPMQLVAGVGNEEDTLATKSVVVMDSNAFPFYPAEVYHQFHNDFQGPAYGAAYNSLQTTLRKAGKIDLTGCPDIA